MILFMNSKVFGSNRWLFGKGNVVEKNGDVYQIDIDWIIGNSEAAENTQGQFHKEYVYEEKDFDKEKIVIDLLFTSKEIYKF